MRELKIGEQQIWTIDNLDVTTYRNGDPIPNVEDAEEWKNLKAGAWCYFENKIDNNSIYGKLYNYYAVVDPRGIAPEGYRVPTHYDWLRIQKFGSRLKSKNDWNEKLEMDYYLPFNAKPGGYRDSYGRFCYRNEAIGWWTSPESDVNNQGNIAHWLYQNDPQLGWKPFFQNDGFYIRCIKETFKTKVFHLNDNLHCNYKSISLKYTSLTTFQELLNLIYRDFLKDKVNSYSYGIDWAIQIYDGDHIHYLNKIGNSDNRIFESLIENQYKTPYRLIISRL
jgi:uncharacterized protein (TIGR02145 family)